MSCVTSLLIIPDKFKGTLTAEQAARAMADGWSEVRPADHLELLPMSDGGDGFGLVMSELLGASRERVRTTDAAHRPIEAEWWYAEDSRTAIVESARVIGLALLPKGVFHPFELDTFGLGAVFEAAARRGARRCLVGVGGSATNDGGTGLARALGWQFFNHHGGLITRWTELHGLCAVRPPEKPRGFEKITVAVDVQNPLLGIRGCSRIYGPQKGLQPSELEFAERCLGQLVRVVALELHRDFAEDPGAGAAGGLGYGLRCFLEAALEPGFEMFAERADLENRLSGADLVLTGEGALDVSSTMGKGVGQIAALCRARGVPCMALAGNVSGELLADGANGFSRAYSLVSLAELGAVMAEPELWLRRLAAQAAREWKPAKD